MKKIFALLLATAMVFAFAACGNEATDPTEAEVATDATETAAPVMTHAEYMAAPMESEVTVETFVQGHQSWWDNKITVYCQSEDGAYLLYELACSEEDAEKLVPGTKIRVNGYKSEWSGEIEIVDGTFEFVNDGETYVAEALDVTELLGSEELINHQNEFASFKGMSVESISYKNDEPGDDIYLTLGYNGASYDFCVEVYLTGVESEVYTTVGTLKAGDKVDVEGFLYWYEGVNPHITAITVAQ